MRLKNDLKNSTVTPSAVSLYVFSSTLTQQEVQKIMGEKGEKIPNPESYHKWRLSNKWQAYEDPARSLQEFIKSVLPRFNDGIDVLNKKNEPLTEIHLILGIADTIRTEEWPDLSFTPEVLQVLCDKRIQLKLFFDQQRGA